jgi:hypothetical protein
MESEGSLLCPQETATAPYREPDESSSHFHNIYKTSILISPSLLCQSLHFRFPTKILFAFIISWFPARLMIVAMGWDCLCGTAAYNGPFVHPPNDTLVNMVQRWHDTDRGKPKDSERILSQCRLSTTDPTWTDLGANRD